MSTFLELHHASVIKNEHVLLNDISLSIAIGEHVAILGHNGAGKSTLLQLLSGDAYPVYQEEPAIRLFGEERWELFGLRKKLAVVSASLQEHYLDHPQCTGHEVILSGLFGSIGLYTNLPITEQDHVKATMLSKKLGLEKLAQQPIGTLSSGELRRFMIGRALINNPQVIVLDEPTNSLDIKARHDFLEIIRTLAHQGHTIILVTHMIEEIIPEISRVIVLKQGRLLTDGPKAETLTPETLSQAFGLSLTVEEHNNYFYLKAN